MSRAAQIDRMNGYASRALLDSEWLDSALVKETFVDLEDPVLFPEFALAREHQRKLKEDGRG